jgi:hypothetical protein
LRQYYATAPALVDAVRNSPNRAVIFNETLQRIRLAVEHIEAGRLSEAFELYGATYCALLNQFLISNGHNG